MKKKKHSERRRSRRVPLEIIIDYSTLDGFFKDYAQNISLGGIFLRTDNPFPAGTKVNLSFSLPGYNGLIETKGEVIWVVKKDDSEEGRGSPGMGIKFEDLSLESKQIIDKLIPQIGSIDED